MAVFEADLARHAPVEVVPVVRTGRDMGGIGKDEFAVCIARHGVGVKHDRSGDRLHVARGRKGACYVVGRYPVGRDLDFARRLAEKRGDGENK